MSSKYDPLTRHLQTVNVPFVTMTLAEIEAVLGCPLPRSARYPTLPWWDDTHNQARGWRDAGYSADPDFRSGRVIFRRSP